MTEKPKLDDSSWPEHIRRYIREDYEALHVEHFRCDCGHQWQREMEDGLVQVDCPVCRRSHLTDLGRFFSHLFRDGVTPRQ